MSVHVYMARLQAYIRAEDWMRANAAAWSLLFEIQELNLNMSTSSPVDVDARTTVCQPNPQGLYKDGVIA